MKDLSKFEEAEMSYRKAIEIKPDYAEAYFNLGILLRIIGKFEDAKLCAEKIMSLNCTFLKVRMVRRVVENKKIINKKYLFLFFLYSVLTNHILPFPLIDPSIPLLFQHLKMVHPSLYPRQQV